MSSVSHDEQYLQLNPLNTTQINKISKVTSMSGQPNSIEYSNGEFLTGSGDPSNSNGGRLNQWVFNNNRIKLLSHVENTQSILEELNNRKYHDSNGKQLDIPINCSLSGLDILQLNLQIDNHKRTKILDLVSEPSSGVKADGISKEENKDSLEDTIGSNGLTSKLFTQQVDSAKQHLRSLEKRIMDSSSKVFITGDLNSGKSSLCNALLKRDVLPTDQLPCTNVFVEVLDSHFNKNKKEEVHAIPMSQAQNVGEAIANYNQYDVNSFQLFTLDDLSDLVLQNEKWSLIVVYLNDSEPSNKENSILHNGIVDIALIDSPGLNMDDIKTTEVFSRQEEIDLVIFVVSAENQLTLSGKDFVSQASREKQFIFFVVNKFNAIKNKDRCKQLIMSQIKDLSPLTYKQSDDFVHFVSSEDNIPNSENNNDDGDDNDNDHQDPDFENLRESLKNFVLKKRSKSKLLPAQTYLNKLLSDITLISEHNIDISQAQHESIDKKLQELKPMLLGLERESTNKYKKVDLLVEKTINDIYDHTRQSINESIDKTNFPVYTGVSEIYEYVSATVKSIKTSIIESVNSSEGYAKKQTVETVDQIYELAKIEPDNRPTFNKDLMFQQRKHKLSKQFDVSFGINDLFQPSWTGFVNFLQWGATIDEDVKFDTYFSQVTKYVSNPSLVFNSKIPSLLVYSFGGAKLITNCLLYGAKIFSWGALKNIGGSVVVICTCLGCAYLINDLPRALPSNLITKYKAVLNHLDYSHSNSSRISKVCRQVLKTPSSEITKKFDEQLIHLNQQNEELKTKLIFYDRNLKFFNGLKEKAENEKSHLGEIDLDVD